MGMMEKVGATLATKYGTVSEGKYKGTIVALGNDPSKKVQATWSFEQIIFLDGTDEKGRHNIETDIKGVSITSETDNGLKVVGLFNSGEHFVFELEWKKDDSFFIGLLKTFLGMKKANQTEAEKNEDKYHHIKTFANTVYTKLSPESAQFLLDFYRKHNVLDEQSEKFLNKLIQAYQKVQ